MESPPELMPVNALAQPSQRVLGVQLVAPQTTKIPSARALIERLELSGRLVQLDGMHTQHQTVQQLLREKRADHGLILRNKQPRVALRVLGLPDDARSWRERIFIRQLSTVPVSVSRQTRHARASF